MKISQSHRIFIYVYLPFYRLLGSGIIELSDIKHTIRGLQAKLERDADTRASLEEKIEILQKSPDKVQDKSNTTLDLTAVDDPKIELMMKISELEEQLTNAKHQEDLKVKDIEAKHDEKMQEIQKQISDLTTENQEHLDLMDFVKCEKEELANENEELKSKLKQLNVNLNNMESENKQLQENTDSLSNEMTEMKSKIEQLADLGTNNEKLKEELVQLKSAKASGSGADEDTSLLDLPGVEEITEDISGDGIPRRNKKAKVQSEIADDNKHVKASGSGSGFVSYLDSSGVDENDDMDDYEIESSLKDSNVSSAIVSKSIKRNTSTSNLDTVHDAERLQKDLTEKYISGQISFEDYIQQLDSDEEDEDEVCFHPNRKFLHCSTLNIFGCESSHS